LITFVECPVDEKEIISIKTDGTFNFYDAV